MKKYNLLWHVFELEPRAHDFLASYVTRIETYAATNNITKDILDDLKYNIIEKLYTAKNPINEAFVMNLAETIGEPEQIFDTTTDEDEEIAQDTTFLNRHLGKEKPMIWGVCYWIAKSFNIPVARVRLLFFIAIFIYGTTIWLYPLLALFVPYEDKKKSSGQVGNLFFELIRGIIWTGIFFFLWASIVGLIGGIVAYTGFPLLSNQSIQEIFPPFYPLASIALISLIILWIGSLGSLLKKEWISKTRAMICIVILFITGLFTGICGYHEFVQYNNNKIDTSKDVVAQLTTPSDTILLTINGEQGQSYNYFPMFFGDEFNRAGLFQEIEILPSEGNKVIVEIEDQFNIINNKQKDTIMSKRTQITAQTSGNTITLDIPSTIFSEKVPFSFAERVINIYVPTNKTIQYINNSQLRYHTPSRRYGESTTSGEMMISCKDSTSFQYYDSLKERRCANTSSELIPTRNDSYRSNDADEPLEDIFGVENLTNDQEDMIQKAYIWLPLPQAQTQATTSGLLLRVVQEDGIELPRTEDYRPGRINVEINKGIITDLDIE